MTLTPLELSHPHEAKKFLAITAGGHRTLENYRSLLGRTGIRLTRVIGTAAALTLLESEPA